MHFCFAISILTMLLLGMPAGAAVNDIFPTDFIALKDGTTVAALYLADRKQEGFYVKGRKQLDGTIDTQITALRLSHHISVGERYTFSPVAVLAWSKSQTAPNLVSNILGDEAKGMADIRLGGSFWLYRNFEERKYAAISLIATLPTGEYNKRQILNIGENRWKWVLSGGLMFPIGEKFVVDLSPEVAWYGDNNDYLDRFKLEQDMSYALTAYLRYRFTPKFQLVTGTQFNRGGAASINGINQNNAPENTRLSIGLLLFTSDNNQWQLRYSRDSEIENGFRTADEIVLRLNKQF